MTVNRKTAREDLASKITTNLTALQRVYDHLPKDLAGESPVCSIESGPVLYDATGDEGDGQPLDFVIGFWVRRSEDAAGAEDLLDDLAQDLTELVRLVYNAEFTQPSDPTYDTVDGVDYRIEFHYLRVWWN